MNIDGILSKLSSLRADRLPVSSRSKLYELQSIAGRTLSAAQKEILLILKMWNILIERYVRHSFLRPSLRHEKMACARRSFNENKRKSRLAKVDWRAGRNFYKLMQINKTTLKLESEPKQKEKKIQKQTTKE